MAIIWLAKEGNEEHGIKVYTITALKRIFLTIHVLNLMKMGIFLVFLPGVVLFCSVH